MVKMAPSRRREGRGGPAQGQASRPGRHPLGHHRAGPGDRGAAHRAVLARTLPARGRAGPGQDLDDLEPLQAAGPEVLAHPVHAGPDALGRDGHRGPARGPGDAPALLPLPARAGLRQHDPGRRDQPHASEDPVRGLGGDAGVAGDLGRGHAASAAAFLRDGHAEPDRAGRDLSSARGAAGPLLPADRGGVSLRRGGAAHRDRDHGRQGGQAGPGADRAPRCWPSRSWCGGCRCRIRRWITRSSSRA